MRVAGVSLGYLPVRGRAACLKRHLSITPTKTVLEALA